MRTTFEQQPAGGESLTTDELLMHLLSVAVATSSQEVNDKQTGIRKGTVAFGVQMLVGRHPRIQSLLRARMRTVAS
jgi:hypothetical protein